MWLYFTLSRKNTTEPTKILYCKFLTFGLFEKWHTAAQCTAYDTKESWEVSFWIWIVCAYTVQWQIAMTCFNLDILCSNAAIYLWEYVMLSMLCLPALLWDQSAVWQDGHYTWQKSLVQGPLSWPVTFLLYSLLSISLLLTEPKDKYYLTVQDTLGPSIICMCVWDLSVTLAVTGR